jgi:hypothetical protein
LSCDSRGCHNEAVFERIPCAFCGVGLMNICVVCCGKGEQECEACVEYGKEPQYRPTAEEMRAEEQYDSWRGK